MMSYNWAKMSYISLKNCPIILYFFRQKSVGTLLSVTRACEHYDWGTVWQNKWPNMLALYCKAYLLPIDF